MREDGVEVDFVEWGDQAKCNNRLLNSGICGDPRKLGKMPRLDAGS